jgi:hypothetical protein
MNNEIRELILQADSTRFNKLSNLNQALVVETVAQNFDSSIGITNQISEIRTAMITGKSLPEKKDALMLATSILNKRVIGLSGTDPGSAPVSQELDPVHVEHDDREALRKVYLKNLDEGNDTGASEVLREMARIDVQETKMSEGIAASKKYREDDLKQRAEEKTKERHEYIVDKVKQSEQLTGKPVTDEARTIIERRAAQL